jgi:hypothetical protein
MPRNVLTKIHIDSVHNSAICDEIGYRLSQILKVESLEVPPYLRELLDRLRQQDRECSPSLVPSLHDMEPAASKNPTSAVLNP